LSVGPYPGISTPAIHHYHRLIPSPSPTPSVSEGLPIDSSESDVGARQEGGRGGWGQLPGQDAGAGHRQGQAGGQQHQAGPAAGGGAWPGGLHVSSVLPPPRSQVTVCSQLTGRSALQLRSETRQIEIAAGISKGRHKTVTKPHVN
jgi:hypothetical protein